jgi:hypothetical protein
MQGLSGIERFFFLIFRYQTLLLGTPLRLGSITRAAEVILWASATRSGSGTGGDFMPHMGNPSEPMLSALLFVILTIGCTMYQT